MFYCPQCMNIYNITKTIKMKEQSGGSKIDDIIKKILNNESIDDIKIDEDDLNSLNKTDNFKKLQNKQKDYIYNVFNDKIKKKALDFKDAKETKNMQNMYFLCKNCGNNELIKEGSVIISRETNRDIENGPSFNPKEYLRMNILPRTRQYVCINDKCDSNKNPEKKSALFMRLPGTYKVRYICESCESVWMVS